ncbi:MAG: hypothetical protein OXH92_01125 [Bryobacterales bacterium]|nr:ATP-binding protein [Gammaproteobacteria bacterium]MDE0432585.1 hypothetical protein [Bryobacterales bacterium]
MALKKAGGNWVDGDRFYDREVDLEALMERVRDGTHTLLTAQRRMGKTSLVRELLRRLAADGEFEPIFVDLEAANTSEDAIAEIAVQSRHAHVAWDRIKSGFVNVLRELGDRVDTLSLSDIQVKLRAGIDRGNWRQKGDEIFAALAGHERRVVLAIDELPILVNRLLKGHDYRITPERRQATDEFMSWLRKNGQAHRERVTLLLSGSVGLGPILRQAELTAHANIYSLYELKPWDDATASKCLAELSETYSLEFPPEVRQDMCRRLRWMVPHHVQQFFDCLHEHLRRERRNQASLHDADVVYAADMLGSRGQVGLDHYEGRLKTVLGADLYRIALDLLTEAAVAEGRLDDDALALYLEHFPVADDSDRHPIKTVLHVLEHDGYLDQCADEYRFLSGLLEDWWRLRHGGSFVPIRQRRG